MRARVLILGCVVVGSAFVMGCGRSHRGGGPFESDASVIRLDAGPRADAGPVDVPRDAGIPPPPPDAGRPPPDAGGPPGDGGPTTSRMFVLHVLSPAHADPLGDPNIVPGFDLDMHVTTSMGDPAGCGFIDFDSGPPDGIRGVDNQLGPILEGVASTIDIPGAFRDSIAAGDMLLLLEVLGIDSFVDDASVTVNIYRGVLPAGVGAPRLGPDALLAPGQTFDIDARSIRPDGSPLTSSPASIIGGRLRAAPARVTLDVGLMSVMFTLDLTSTQLRFNIAAGGGINTGVLGGTLQIEEVVASFAATAPDLEMTIRTILSGQADLEPDARGVCTAVSIGLVFAGVPAIRGVVVAP